jgi:hypothetical protein
LTPADRSAQARIAALTKHAMGDPREATKPARAAFLARFEAQVDPRGELEPAERQRRAARARRAYMLNLARKSAIARAKSGGAADVTP